MPEFPPAEVITLGGNVDRITVTVRAVADDLNPDEVSRALGAAPTFAARKGAKRSSAGREFSQPTGVWYFEPGDKPKEWRLGEAIDALLERLPTDLTIWDGLAAKCRLELLCGLHLACWNRGIVLDPTLLRRLADRHLKLGLDIYCYESDEDEQPG